MRPVAPIGTLPPQHPSALNAAPGAPLVLHHQGGGGEGPPGVRSNHPQRPNDDPFHDPTANGTLRETSLVGGGLAGSSSDVVDELLKPFQSYFSIYRTGQYTPGSGISGHGDSNGTPGMATYTQCKTLSSSTISSSFSETFLIFS